jgi:hypothetical protein
MTEGSLDTPVEIDWDDPVVASALPDDASVSAVTLADLAAGPQLASSRAEAARRPARLKQIERPPSPWTSTPRRPQLRTGGAGREHHRSLAPEP